MRHATQRYAGRRYVVCCTLKTIDGSGLESNRVAGANPNGTYGVLREAQTRVARSGSPPVPGELGQRIYDNISQQAWEMWQEHSRLLINHYGLNLADPDARQILRQEMEAVFLRRRGRATKPEGWEPEGPMAEAAQGQGRRAPRHARNERHPARYCWSPATSLATSR